MVPSPRNHIYRLALLLVVAIAGFLWIKGWFVPHGWDEQRWFRSGALEELKHQPIVFGGNKACTEGCHGKTSKDHAAIGRMLSAGVHANLGCESCHGPLYEGEHQKTAAAQIHRDSGLCLRCHDSVAARPLKVGLFSESLMAHQALDVKRDSNCTQCHDPHAPREKAITADDGQTANALLPSVMALAGGGCNSCHKPGVPYMPLIAGQPEEYLKVVMQQHRDGSRKSLVMGDLLKGYSNEQIANLAQYYAAAGWTSAREKTNAELVNTGAALHQRRCAGCHGTDGSRSGGMTPRLAGQTMSHIKAQLNSYLDPRTKLPNELMSIIAKGLSPSDIDALAHFYAAEPVPQPQAEDLRNLTAGCNSCHQPGFRDMPLIAGQPEEYLRVIMLQYRDGSRSSRVMGGLLKTYSTEVIRGLARHYAQSEWISTREKTDATLMKAGATLHASGCAGCHGRDGRTAQGMTPRLAGQPAGYIEAQLKGYQDPKTRLPDRMMRALSTSLSANDIRALAQFYAANTLKPAAPAEAATPSAVNVDVSTLTPECDDCHHPGGKPRMPLIAGQPEEYLRVVMREQRDRVRHSPVMADHLKDYSDEQIAALAGHYARQKWVSAPQDKKDEAAVKAGAAVHQRRCAGCHGPQGLKAEGMTPRLAGQNARFLEAELTIYRDPSVKRPHAMMRLLSQALKPEEVSALAAYYSSKME